ncbi:MAG: polyphosphate kinase 1 [Thermoleophilaceae bacterium]|nr:polyphosphate kinase 1 [Thermoleophilaceae bacterium]
MSYVTENPSEIEPPTFGVAQSDPVAPPLDSPELYTNRELTWVDFNDRVLQLAEDDRLPLLERLKFLAIFASNLDEFFMIRVAGLHDQVDAGIDPRGPDGLSPSETIDGIGARVRPLYVRQAEQFGSRIAPALAEEGLRIASCEDCSPAELEAIDKRFNNQIFPALTPLGVGHGRPFPYISNLSLSLAVSLRDPESGVESFARVKVPKEVLPRFMEIDVEEQRVFVPLESVIARNLDELFPGMEITGHEVFRVARDADFTVSDEADDLVRAVEAELRRRRFGEVVRLEVGAGMDPQLRARLIEWLELEERQVYDIDGLLDMADLWQIYGLDEFKRLREKKWTPTARPPFAAERDDQPDVFAAMRQGDLVVHHPYDSFALSVERFLAQAVMDPDVLAIKMTVYRTSDDSGLVPALIQAAEQGKQTVCMLELKARFDERRNIEWARALEEVGAHVVHGLPGLKTHCKALLVVRREGDGTRNYVHIGTGNYHAKTARLYEDFGFFTSDPDITGDVADMFNLLTGFARPSQFQKLLVAPAYMRDGLLEQIERTVEAHRQGGEARITIKCNSLVDQRSITALYEASQAGVQVDINVRGICCLMPGVEGVSENIRVRSVVGRFLEHSRIYAFRRGGDEAYFIGSADLMPRNLDDRVELLVPIESPAIRAELADTLERCLADDTFSWELRSDGSWERRSGETRCAHEELMEQALDRMVVSD